MISRSGSSSFDLRLLVLAIALSLGGGSVLAQSTAGDISGTATNASGAVVVIKGLDSGLSRTVELAPDGKFRVPSLPSGRYEVQLVRDGHTLNTSQVTVLAGQTAQLNLGTEATQATRLSTVTVSANAIPPIDVSSSETRTTFSASQLNALPVPRDIVSVATLAPGVVKGNDTFGNLPSFGGSSVAENSYYVNGFNVTNLYNNLSFGEVPFQAIDQLDVQSGGYGAQYGLSTGGVTSVNIKRGTNEWKGGVSWNVAPDWARASSPNVMRANGTTFREYDKNTKTSNTYDAWLGGPLIKDKLFLFALAEFTKSNITTYGASSTSSLSNANSTTTANDLTTKSPYWVVKLDWNITDANHLEYTGFNNTDNNTYRYYNAPYVDGVTSKTTTKGDLHNKEGGLTNIVKYTGYLTDDLTLTAQWGKMDSDNSSYTVSPAGIATRYNGNINAPASGCAYTAYNGVPWGPATCAMTSSVDIYGGKDQREAWRVDLDWRLGDHELGVGYSDESWSSDAGSSYSGGAYHYYYSKPSAKAPGLVMTKNFRTGGHIDVDQKAWYLEDHWQATEKLMLYGGLRNDSFNNKNGAGESFVKQENIWQPRLGFSWDVMGDASFKVAGSAGRYSLPIAANVALRAATASLFVEDDSLYSAINPDGSPVLVGTKGSQGALHLQRRGWQYARSTCGGLQRPEAVRAGRVHPRFPEDASQRHPLPRQLDGRHEGHLSKAAHHH